MIAMYAVFLLNIMMLARIKTQEWEQQRQRTDQWTSCFDFGKEITSPILLAAQLRIRPPF